MSDNNFVVEDIRTPWSLSVKPIQLLDICQSTSHVGTNIITSNINNTIMSCKIFPTF